MDSEAGTRGGSRARGGAAGPGEPGRPDRLTAVCAYAALLLLGGLQALIGTFQYSRGPAPLAAVCFDLGILATCVLGAWGMGSPAGGLMPGAGWFLVSFILATGTRGGSILVTNTTAGEWFLFGGAGCAAVGCLVAYVGWSKAGPARRGGAPPRGTAVRSRKTGH